MLGLPLKLRNDAFASGDGICYDLGEVEKFLMGFWELERQCNTTIKQQWGQDGALCRLLSAFTLMKGCQKAVQWCFCRAFTRRAGSTVVNLSSTGIKAHTALSDIEVILRMWKVLSTT